MSFQSDRDRELSNSREFYLLLNKLDSQSSPTIKPRDIRRLAYYCPDSRGARAKMFQLFEKAGLSPADYRSAYASKRGDQLASKHYLYCFERYDVAACFEAGRLVAA